MSVETTETWLRVRGCGFHVIAMPPMPPIAMESDNCSLFLTMLAEWSSYCNAIIIQTEASRRRREAEVQQAMENGLGSCMYVCMYICMFFTYISQFTAHTEFKSVPFASPFNATLLRNEFSWVRYPTSAWHVKIAKKSTKIPEWRKIMWKLAAEHSQFWRYQ